MAYWQEHSLGIAPQLAGFGTPNSTNGDFVYLQGELPKLQLTTDIAELDLMTGQIGAAPERLPGRRHGTISMSMPLEGLKNGYDPTTDDPGDTGILPPWMALVGNSLGSQMGAAVDTAAKFWSGLHLSVSQYTAAGVASAISTAITMDDATASDKIDVGQLVATAASAATSTVQFGFAKTKSGQVVTLFEASGNTVNSNAANCYGTGTAWLSSAHGNQIPMTMRYVGENTEACYVLQDCICTGWKLTWEAGTVPTIEFSFDVGEFTIDKTLGGLQVPAVFSRIPQIVGANNGRATVGGALKCGLESCVIEYKTEIAAVKCHAATQGITSVTYKKPRVTVSCSVPWVSTDAVYDAAGSAGNTGSHLWQSMLERGTATSIGVYVGSNIGRLFAFLVPSAKIVATPQLADLNGATGYQLTIEASSYTGDTTDTAETSATSPLDSLFRVSVG